MRTEIKKWVKKVGIFLVCIFASVILTNSSHSVYGVSQYNSRYQKCIDEAGGRGDIEAVKQACFWASGGEDNNTKNGCSLWIGDLSSSTSTTIHVNQSSGEIDVNYYGMCTDYTDRTLDVQVEGACGAFATAPKLERGTWGSPGAIKSQLNVDKLKSCVGECGTKTFTVGIKRVNGESGHVGYTTQTVTVEFGDEECPPDPKEDKCNDWAPASYTNSSDTGGTTSIDLWIRNDRLKGSGNWMGKWGQKDIWAEPTDTISWRTCYFPGVQKTYNTKITRLNGMWEGYFAGKTPEDLPTDSCLSADWTVREFKELHKVVGSSWQNRFTWSGDASGSTLTFRGDGGRASDADWEVKESVVSLRKVMQGRLFQNLLKLVARLKRQ